MKLSKKILEIGLAGVLASGCTSKVIDKYSERESIYWSRDLVMLYPPTYETRKYLDAEDFIIILKDVYGTKMCHTSEGAYASLQIGDTIDRFQYPCKTSKSNYVYYWEK